MPRQPKQSRAPRPQGNPNPRKPVTKEELRGLEDEIKIKFDWVHEPQPHQMQGIIAQLQMRDALVHAGTGSGKTMIAAGPHAHRSSEGKVTLMISPLIALHDEQVETFRDEFKLKAIAVNSSNGGCKPEVLRDIIKGEHQIVLISPEMALSRRFIREVLRSPEFGRRVLSIVVDEAHVVSHWGASFRKKYGTLGIVRAFLPRGTPIVALSATLPARVRNDVMSKLQFGKDYANIDIGNDRPNVSIIVRAIQHPMNSYADLDFIAEGVTHPSQMKKGFIYADNIATGVEIVDHVTDLLPPELRKLGLIRPYNAALSKEYRREAMRQFKNGDIRILVCTDAARMGCNISDIELVVQWKLPGSVSIFVQRAGRAARGRGRTGIAVLLVEPSAYGVDVEELISKAAPARGKRKKEHEKGDESAAARKRKAQKQKAHAKARGVNRGSVGGKHDAIFVKDTPPLDPEATDEGLHVLLQAGTCRRNVLTKIYNNKEPVPQVPCCDICCPTLLNQTCPGKLLVVPRQSAIKRGVVNKDVQWALDMWRIEILARDYPSSLYSPSMILRDETIALLSSVGPIQDLVCLKTVLAGQWLWMDEYGETLCLYLAKLQIPPMQPLPKKSRAPKHPHPDADAAQDVVQESSPARQRVDVAAPVATQLPITSQTSSEALAGAAITLQSQFVLAEVVSGIWQRYKPQ
ncbi:P-loop containing nucleoside triphosphate hydrolase protein [Mycena haematopus]|nr:P-loop containing nucleoside triphosphate hydrolase protein [Mycena haematopus]